MGTKKYIRPILSIGDNTDVDYDLLIAPEEPQKSKKKSETSITQDIIDFCNNKGYTYKIIPLPAFDFIINIGNGECLERKTVEDLIDAISAKVEKLDGKTRFQSQIDRMSDPDIFPSSLNKILFIQDGFNKKARKEIWTEIIKNKEVVKSNFLFDFSPSIEIKDLDTKYKSSSYEWKKTHSAFNVNRWLSLIMKIQDKNIKFVELSGKEGTIEFFRWRFDKAIEQDKQLQSTEERIQCSIAKPSKFTKDCVRLQIILQQFSTGFGSSRVNKLLLHYKTLDNFFKSVSSLYDFLPATTRLDGTLDKITEEAAKEYFRIMNIEYNPNE